MVRQRGSGVTADTTGNPPVGDGSTPLLPPQFSPLVPGAHWFSVRDADARASHLFKRHYSANPRRTSRNFAGPNEKMVLLTLNADALFVWRKQLYRMDGQQGINCAVFRNESSVLSSTLIREACALAWNRWPGERLFTFVNGGAVRSSQPGACFRIAGWRHVGYSKGGLLIWEILPPETEASRRD